MHLYRNHIPNYTTISNLFIEQYMPEASGEFVKVYLYLLRCFQSADTEVSITAIADLLNHTDNDIVRALKYWEKQGLLALETDKDDQVSGLHLLEPISQVPLAPLSQPSSENTPAVTAALEQSPAAVPAAVLSPVPEPHAYSTEEIQAFSNNPDIPELFYIVQTYINHPLSDTDTNLILFWYDELKFPSDLIIYLVDYCVSKGHSATRYMNKVALAWAEEGISTAEDARKNAAIHNQVYYGVMKALGIHGRALVPSENEFISKWTSEYGFSMELIEDACARTVSATHQSSFEYTDSILTKWHKEGIKTMEDVRKSDAAFAEKKKNQGAVKNTVEKSHSKNQFLDFHQRSYDPDELERMLLNTNI